MRLGVATLALLVACDGTPGTPGADGSLVRIETEPPGANCAAGGVAISTGADTNGNGVLDPDEVTDIQYVCNDESGDSLVRIDDEPPGPNCASGGIAISTGIDDNHNGVLDDSEVASTTFVCQPPERLLRVVGLPPPTPCPDGGFSILTGLDRDQDGVLDDTEILSVETVCAGGFTAGTVLEGDFTAMNALDLAVLQTFTEVTGNVRVERFQASVVLPNLQLVAGDLNVNAFDHVIIDNLVRVDGGGLSTGGMFASASVQVSVPSLVTVTGGLVVEGDSINLERLEAIELAPGETSAAFTIRDATSLILGPLTETEAVLSLSRVGLPSLVAFNDLTSVGSLSIVDFASADVAELALPSLTTVGRDIRIENFSNVGSIRMPALVSVERDVIIQTPATETSPPLAIELPTLQTVGRDMQLRDLPALSVADFSSLEIVAGFLTMSTVSGPSVLRFPSLAMVGRDLNLDNLTGVTRLEFPALTTIVESLIVIRMDDLATLAFDALASLGGALDIEDNIVLPTCEAEALRDQLVAAGFDGAVFISGNDDAGVCP